MDLRVSPLKLVIWSQTSSSCPPSRAAESSRYSGFCSMGKYKSPEKHRLLGFPGWEEKSQCGQMTHLNHAQQTARSSHHPLTWHELPHVCSVAGCRAKQSTNQSAQERPGRNRNLAASGREERPDPRPLSQRVRGPGHTAGAAAEKLLDGRGNGIILIIAG